MSSRLKYFGIVFALLVGATALYSFVPQTITVDGTNDFLVANLMDPDGFDAQFPELDMDSVFVTNDANKLFLGVQYSKGGWTTNQVGFHIATGDPAGGTTDSWGRAIAWNTAPRKPDYQAYVNLDNMWQELRKWNSGGGTWDAVYAGIGSLGWVNNTGFEELGLNLSDLGVTFGDTIYIEVVISQDGSTKGPFDCMVNDADQLSTDWGGTTWDVGAPVELDSMMMYIIQASSDAIPPTVVDASAVTSSSLIITNQVKVTFSESVDETTAENPANYSLTNFSNTVDSAVVDPLFPDRVTLYLSGVEIPTANMRSVTVTNVQDLATNVIVANGTTNVGCYFVQGVIFRARMAKHFLTHTFPIDSVTVEGGSGGLTWGGCDNGFLSLGAGDVFQSTMFFSLPGTGCGTGSPSAERVLEWKLMHQCVEYESIGNRVDTLKSAVGAYDTLDVWWDNEDPTQFTTHAIDVIFTVDANSASPTVDSTVAINGDVFPLTFTVPSPNEMADDGVAPDVTAGDGVYALKVRFEENSFKTVEYKYLFEDVYECALEGNREVWLNDAAYDTVGGTNGPLVMPLQYYDRCSTSGRAVEVIFKLNARWVFPTSSDTVAVNGSVLPLNWNVPSLNEMRDDGVYPDDTANDDQYAASVIFPDSSNKYVEYKFLFNSTYECTTQTNRFFVIDDVAYDDTGTPMVLELDNWNLCEVTGIDADTPASPFALRQNYPNPFNPMTTIAFTSDVKGRAILRIYNVRGALVSTLFDNVVKPGQEVRIGWNGKDNHGRDMASGVYFYDLQVSGQRATRKMVLLR